MTSSMLGPDELADLPGDDSDTEEDESDDQADEAMGRRRSSKKDRASLSKSVGHSHVENDLKAFLQQEGYDDDDNSEEKSLDQLKQVNNIADEALSSIQGRLFNAKSSPVFPDAGEEPAPPRRVRNRRAGIVSRSSTAPNATKQSVPTWKPLSSGQHDPTPEEKEQIKKEDAEHQQQQQGLAGLWNKLTTSFTSEAKAPAAAVSPVQPSPSVPKKEISGATYFRRAKRRAEKCQFLQAVALFNFALVRQREEMGEDHVNCATTLNEIGVCWMMLGERYPAMTAFEEALYIRQRRLGHGAMEVAETTNNIWMILHEERQELEGMMEEGNEEEDEEWDGE
jgi:tetratricopeptide (TPR) repeat protein